MGSSETAGRRPFDKGSVFFLPVIRRLRTKDMNKFILSRQGERYDLGLKKTWAVELGATMLGGKRSKIMITKKFSEY